MFLKLDDAVTRRHETVAAVRQHNSNMRLSEAIQVANGRQTSRRPFDHRLRPCHTNLNVGRRIIRSFFEGKPENGRSCPFGHARETRRLAVEATTTRPQEVCERLQDCPRRRATRERVILRLGKGDTCI